MAIRDFEVVIGGSRLMMHNIRLADVLDPFTKALKAATSSRDRRTDEGQVAISYAEFMGGLYCDAKAGPYAPDTWLAAMVLQGAKKQKLGKVAAANIVIVDEINPIQYDGPRTPEGLWKAGSRFVDRRGVGNQKNKIMRTRPIFRDWSIRFVVRLLDDRTLNPEDIRAAIEDQGPYGIGDGRPMVAGKFALVSFKEIKGKK